MKKKLILTLCTVLIAFFAFTGIATSQPLPGGLLEMGWTTDSNLQWTIYDESLRLVGGGNMRGSAGTYGLSHGGLVHFRLPGTTQEGVVTVSTDGPHAGLCSSFESVEMVLEQTRGYIVWNHPKKEDYTVIKTVYVFDNPVFPSDNRVTQVVVTGIGRLDRLTAGNPFFGHLYGDTTSVTIDYVTIDIKSEPGKPNKFLTMAQCRYDFAPGAAINVTVRELP